MMVLVLAIHEADRETNVSGLCGLAVRILAWYGAATFRFCSDVDIVARPEAEKGFRRIVSLLNDPANFIEFKLQSNEVLVFDSTAVLHGRTDFAPKSGRILHGPWLDGQPVGESLALGFKGEAWA